MLPPYCMASTCTNFYKLGNFDRSLSYQVYLLNFSSLQTFPSYTLLKIWNNLPLELKRSTSINLFKNKIKKALFEKYLLKCNRPNCFSCKQWYHLINKFVHAYFLWKNTWKYIRFHYQITVNDLNCVPKCKVFPALYTSLFLQASNVLCN